MSRLKSYNLTQSAKLLDMSRPTLYTYIDRFKTIVEPHIQDRRLSVQGLDILRQIVSYRQTKTMSDEEITDLVSLRVEKHGPAQQSTAVENEGNISHGEEILARSMDFLRQTLEQAQRDKEYLQQKLNEAKEEAGYHDDIIARLSEQNTRLLESLSHRDRPFWRRWGQRTRKSQYEQDGNVEV